MSRSHVSRSKELRRQLGDRYSYEQLLDDREIQRLRREIPHGFSETVAATLTADCLRLTAVLYRCGKDLLLGYDLFVKDDPGSPEWIFYDSLTDPVSLKEADMLRVMDRTAAAQGLSYTETCFNQLNGKTVKKV